MYLGTRVSLPALEVWRGRSCLTQLSSQTGIFTCFDTVLLFRVPFRASVLVLLTAYYLHCIHELRHVMLCFTRGSSSIKNLEYVQAYGGPLLTKPVLELFQSMNYKEDGTTGWPSVSGP